MSSFSLGISGNHRSSSGLIIPRNDKFDLQKDFINLINDSIKKRINPNLTTKEILSENIGKNVSDNLAKDALWSLIIASILILIYSSCQY